MMGLCGALWHEIYCMGSSLERPWVRVVVVFFSLWSIVRLIGSIMLANWLLHVYGNKLIDVINVESLWCGGWVCVCGVGRCVFIDILADGL